MASFDAGTGARALGPAVPQRHRRCISHYGRKDMAKHERGFDERSNDTTSRSVQEPKGWKDELQDIIDANGHKRANRQASHRTMELSAEVLFVIFKTLHHKLNRPIHPRNLAEAHIKLLAQYWYTANKAWRGKPSKIRCDSRPEYVSDALRDWAVQRGVAPQFMQPGKPQQNAYIER